MRQLRGKSKSGYDGEENVGGRGGGQKYERVKSGTE